jgi:hypothetical protein
MNANNKNILKTAVGAERAKLQVAAWTQEGSELPELLVQLALNEAESLAWETEYPQLVFPALAEEKIATLSDWYDEGHGRRAHNGEYAMAV